MHNLRAGVILHPACSDGRHRPRRGGRGGERQYVARMASIVPAILDHGSRDLPRVGGRDRERQSAHTSHDNELLRLLAGCDEFATRSIYKNSIPTQFVTLLHVHKHHY